ncbi:F-box/FBD/LRR-repeat protein At1g80470-like [Panicum virgatum]|uniref:Uncharacterized protein n=1 Tax=Panicum virgatum TaxID=38727 RepID=A0A8T0N6T4_PANVG|nr:F-box/FBD/LRR-repeat protein At1g80470-like [Panicum virgatum]KAG2544887.1 hypothetical protein PVAP13_9KG390506 [Panicum virgatum]
MDEAATTQQTGQGPPADQEGAAVDLLSGLCDDVLVRILGLAAHARDAVRTGALSRRWRGLWRRVPALRFDSERWFEHGGSARGFMAFVDDTLALRARSGDGGGGGLEQLEILLLRWDGGKGKQQLVPPPSVGIIGAAERWIWHAMRHGVKSFHFELELPDRGDAEETHVMALDELPSSANLEAMYLYLSHATVRLPATVAFASLTDLTLEGLQVAGDDVVLLARLASAACCPVLHKLHMGFITLVGEQKLVLDAGELTELSLADVDGMGSLELTTPSLRVLRIDGCKELESLAASATPRLEKLACQRNHHLLSIDRELPSVSRLKVDLYAYSGYRSIKLL